MEKLRVLIADDHPLFRRGLRALLAAQPDLEVAGEAADADAALEQALALRPEVILMDLNMPGGGIEATRRVARELPEARVLVVTMYKDHASVFTALRAGAHGYVLKDADEEEMLRAVRAVGGGEAIFSPGVASRVLTYFARPHPTLPPEVFPELTAREREILGLITQGKGNPDISRELGLTPKTVANYVSNIFSKLQVADRTEAADRARAAGMGRAEPEN